MGPWGIAGIGALGVAAGVGIGYAITRKTDDGWHPPQVDQSNKDREGPWMLESKISNNGSVSTAVAAVELLDWYGGKADAKYGSGDEQRDDALRKYYTGHKDFDVELTYNATRVLAAADSMDLKIDGKATLPNFKRLVEAFDVNEDSRLDRAEFNAFQTLYDEQLVKREMTPDED